MFRLFVDIWRWHPPVGVWIGVLGFIAVLVPLFWEKLGKKAQSGVMSLIFLLLLLEVKSIYQDSAEHQAEFNETLARIETIISESTRGNSYLYFDISPAVGPSDLQISGVTYRGYIEAAAVPHFVGEYPLHDVVVFPFCAMGMLPSVNYGTYLPNEMGRPRETILMLFPPRISKDNMHCNLMINASNGSYSQAIQFLMRDGHWTLGWKFLKYGSSHFNHEYYSEGFPKDYKWPKE